MVAMQAMTVQYATKEDTSGRKRYEGLRCIQVNDDKVLSVQKIRERT